MLEAIDHEQLLSWYAYYRLHPWDQANRNAALLAALVANALRKEGDPPMRIEDFMPGER